MCGGGGGGGGSGVGGGQVPVAPVDELRCHSDAYGLEGGYNHGLGGIKFDLRARRGSNGGWQLRLAVSTGC